MLYLCNSGGLWRIWILWGGGYGLDLLTAEWARSWKPHLGALFAFLGLIPSKSILISFQLRSFFGVPDSLFCCVWILGGLFLSCWGNGRPTAWAEAGMCSYVLGLFDEAFFFGFFSGRIDSDLVRDVLCWSASYLILSYCSVDARAASADWRAELPAVDPNTSTRVLPSPKACLPYLT